MEQNTRSEEIEFNQLADWLHNEVVYNKTEVAIVSHKTRFKLEGKVSHIYTNKEEIAISVVQKDNLKGSVHFDIEDIKWLKRETSSKFDLYRKEGVVSLSFK
ncbi:hypothetical protein ACQUY5_24490 [Bacillus cereus]|uniref:hypothetical protein n=1 Tax=Bacillus cereus TaxID=1396 RepID=UPI003D170FD2